MFGQKDVWTKIVWPKGCLDNRVVWTKLGPRGCVQQGSICRQGGGWEEEEEEEEEARSEAIVGP